MEILPETFWKLTYAEFCEKVDGFVKKQRREYNESIRNCWYMAYLTRVKNMPSLKSLQISEEQQTRHEMTDDQMMAMARMLNAAFGGDEVTN